MTSLTRSDLSELVTGELILAGDGEYEAARAVWNGSIDRRPLAIVPCRSVMEVAEVVRAAARLELPLAIRGGGHSAPGFSTCDEGIVIDLAPMREVRVDPAAQVARVGGGARWGEFDRAAAAHGLATTGGMVSTTGVGGLTLGGGIGWLMRAFGLSCDNLRGAELVTAAGEVVRAGPGGDEALLWGLRGGGGNFGVITSFEFRVHPLPGIVGGLALFPAARALEVGAFYREWEATLPDEFSTMLILLTAPAEDFVPAELQGELVLAVAGCHIGSREAAEEDLRPLREQQPSAHLFEPMAYVDLQSMFDADYPAGDRYYMKGGFVDRCGDDLIALALEHMQHRPDPRCEFDFHQMGGAVELPGEHTAFPGRSAPFNYNVIAGWVDPAADGANRAWARAFAAELNELAGAGTYINFLTDIEPDMAERAYGEERYARLSALKRRYDPTNVFRLNQNVLP